MSLKNKLEDISGKKGTKVKSMDGGKIVEIVILILIIVSSVNLLYWLVPTFLSVSFVLIQLRKYINFKVKK